MKKLFLQPALAYVQGMMSSLEAGAWVWTQSMTNELSVMLLTAAWVVRVQDSIEHRQWLSTVADKLLAYQVCMILRIIGIE